MMLIKKIGKKWFQLASLIMIRVTSYYSYSPSLMAEEPNYSVETGGSIDQMDMNSRISLLCYEY